MFVLALLSFLITVFLDVRMKLPLLCGAIPRKGRRSFVQTASISDSSRALSVLLGARIGVLLGDCTDLDRLRDDEMDLGES